MALAVISGLSRTCGLSVGWSLTKKPPKGGPILRKERQEVIEDKILLKNGIYVLFVYATYMNEQKAGIV
jgi:hypothetical protein